MSRLLSDITASYLLYLFYGAAFLFLGVSIVAKNMKGSDLKLAGRLWLLGMFGFFHGTHEWLEPWPLLEGEHLTLQEIFFAKAVNDVIVAISFIFLLLFGLSLIRVLEGKGARWTMAVPAVLVFIWGFHIWNSRSLGDMQFLRQADIGVRHTFGFVGSLMTAYGLIIYSHETMSLSSSVSRRLSYAGIAFIFYAVFTGLAPSGSTIPLLHVRIELFRGISASLIAYFIVNALNIFDVEARKKIEQQTNRLAQAEKLTSLGQLAAGIAHEINNPLTNASLNIQTLKGRLRGDGEKSDTTEKLDAVERNIDRASSIAQELLQFSRQRESEFIPVDINRVIIGALSLMKHRLKSVDVDQHLMPLPAVLGDPGKLQQVFINLLSNSLEAMPEGGEIFLSTSCDGDYVCVLVNDTGPGIPAEHLSRVFEPFFTTKDVGKGTGLGLSICYGIIRQHHGFIYLSSDVRIGTTATIKLPIKERYEEDIDRGR